MVIPQRPFALVAEATPEVQTGNTDEPLANAVHPEVEAYLGQGKGSEGPAPETTQAQENAPVDDFEADLKKAQAEAVAAAAEQSRLDTANRIERENADRARASQLLATQQAHRDSYLAGMSQRPEELAAWLRQQGLDEPAIAAAKKWATDWANNHHGLGVQQYQGIALAEAEATQIKAFNDATKELLPADQQRAYFGTLDKPVQYSSIGDAAKALYEVARKDTVTKAEAKAMVALELSKYTKSLEDKGLLQGTRSQRSVAGSTPVGTGNIRTSLENDEAFNDGRIDRDTWKRNDDAFRKGT